MQITPEIIKNSAKDQQLETNSEISDNSLNDGSDSSEYSSFEEDNCPSQTKLVNTARPRDESPNSKRNRKKATRDTKAEKCKDSEETHQNTLKIRVSSQNNHPFYYNLPINRCV